MLLFFVGEIQMPSKIIASQPFFSARVWVKTSEVPMCSNPNCCSNTSWVEKSNAINRENTQDTGKCTNEQHNAHCCRAEGNKTCAPRDWRVLYQQCEPEWKHMLRRKWMGRWMSGQCTLHEAVLAYEDEWGSQGGRERRAAA